MPICINNPKRNYKGNEPSPKGLGYCASGEIEGKIKEGKDKNLWIKKNGRWQKYNQEDKKDTKRKSPKRKSPKRKSPKRKSPK